MSQDAKVYTPEEYTGPTQFVHLHNHTVFSTLDGVATPEQYAARCKQRGYPAMSATEHGHMGSVPDMLFAFKKFGLKYIPGCFLPGQPVMTISGVETIDTIRPGQLVLTDQNLFRRVINTQERPYNGEVVRIKAWGVEEIVATPEHPFLVRTIERTDTGTKRFGHPVLAETESVGFVKAGELTRHKYPNLNTRQRHNKRNYRHYLCVPRLSGVGIDTIAVANYIFPAGQDVNLVVADGVIVSATYMSEGHKTIKAVNLPASLPLDEELLWIAGLWLAEGSVDAAGPHFSLGADEYAFYERIAAYFAQFDINTTCRARDGDGEGRPRAALDVQVYSSYFARLFVGLFGSGFSEKRIPSIWLTELSAAQSKALVDGIFDGDGKIGTQQSTLKLSNLSLVWQVRLLMTKFDEPQYSAVTPIKCNNSDNLSYSIRRRESGHYYYDYDDKYLYLPVYDVQREQYAGMVYNMEVEEDNTYNVGVAVHNCEIYFNDYEPMRREKFGGKSLRPLKESEPDLYTNIMRNRHLTLLAKNEVGFQNLIKLTTQAYETGYYYRPRIWFDKLCEYKEGLIVLSGCLNGPVSHELRRTDPDGKRTPRLESEDKRGAVDWIRKFKKAFGEDYFIELQMPGIPGDEWVFRQQIALADHFKIKLTLANDCHYLRREDFELQRIMMAIDQKTTVDDPNLFHVNSDEQFMKSRPELWARFKNCAYSKGIPDSVFEAMCDNTLLVAERCQTPKFDANPKYPSLEDADKRLVEMVYGKLKDRGLHKIKKKYLIDGREVTYKEQMMIELERIIDKGFSSYFLITNDLITFGQKNQWPFSPRGSAGGSLVNYLLDISPINPLPWGLSFDRFLSPSRGGFMLKCQMPDPIMRNGQPVEAAPPKK